MLTLLQNRDYVWLYSSRLNNEWWIYADELNEKLDEILNDYNTRNVINSNIINNVSSTQNLIINNVSNNDNIIESNENVNFDNLDEELISDNQDNKNTIPNYMLTIANIDYFIDIEKMEQINISNNTRRKMKYLKINRGLTVQKFLQDNKIKGYDGKKIIYT